MTQKRLTDEILNGAQSPDMFRVNGAVSNSDDFAMSFKCKLGTHMNPDPKERQKCKLF